MVAKRIFNGTLTPDTVEVVEPDASYRQARVLNVDGAAEIYVRGDGVDPEPPWDDCELIPAVIGFIVIRLPRDRTDGIAEVRMRSPGAPVYNVKFWS